jgi:hypothetical protein
MPVKPTKTLGQFSRLSHKTVVIFFPFFVKTYMYGPCFITVPDHLEEVGSKSPAVLQAGFKLNAILSLLYYQLQKQFLNLKFHQCHLQPLGTRRTFGHSWSDNPYLYWS